MCPGSSAENDAFALPVCALPCATLRLFSSAISAPAQTPLPAMLHLTLCCCKRGMSVLQDAGSLLPQRRGAAPGEPARRGAGLKVRWAATLNLNP